MCFQSQGRIYCEKPKNEASNLLEHQRASWCGWVKDRVESSTKVREHSLVRLLGVLKQKIEVMVDT